MSTSPQLQNLLNFRDVAKTVNEFRQENLLKPGLLFRSARPDEATGADREQLVTHYGIKTIIDLRTTTEHINAAKKHTKTVALVQPAVVPASNNLTAETVKIPGIRYAEINLNGKGFERSLIWQLRYFSLAKLIGLMAFGYRMEAISIIGREVLQPRGLIGLGVDTLEHSGVEIKQVFDVLSDENMWPVMVHCTQGKDRTGIIVVLVLLLCGVDVDSITVDYVKSETELESEMEERMKEISSIGLDKSFAKCPQNFPREVTRHIEERHGTIQNYLRGLGINEEKLLLIRSILRVNHEHS